jgi:alpha-galactosidase
MNMKPAANPHYQMAFSDRSLRLQVASNFAARNGGFLFCFVWLLALLSLPVVAQTNSKPTLFLIGDSTVRNGSGKGVDSMWGWGSLIDEHFDATKIKVENRAIGGRSSRTFLSEGRWNEVLKEIQPGDFVMMQFGHNDGGGLTGNRGRGSLKGNGDETQTITNNAGKVETVHTYGWYLRQYIAGTKEKGATPIVVSQIPRNIWKGDKVGRESSGYGKFAKEAAQQGGAAFLDLNELVAMRYEQIGAPTVREMFFKPTDHTHTTLAGAKLNAACVAEGVRGLKDTALASYLLPPEQAPAKTDFLTWAPRPPMGWNSWDCFATTVTEAQTKAQADYMAAKLKKHGWEYIVVDIQWYEPNANSFNYRKDAPLVTDEFGRLLPATNRFPSAANGGGFKSLSDYVHGKGLKFGIHLMRGIPRQAVRDNTLVKGTTVRARDIANTNSICTWNPDMYGVDMSKPGAQAYYDSVFELIASWGVDYVKVDDLSRPYHANEKEVEAIRKAIDRTGRPMVLSLSPGETALTAAEHVQQHANLWRISDDFWDNWPALHEQFARLRNWNPSRGPGHWPDADMLPFGVLEMGKRKTRFTPDEQYTVMTLWSIARSPLMHGGDMTKMDDFTLSLLTNDEVLAVNQTSSGNKELFHRDNFVVWVADVANSKDKYLAVFNAPASKTNLAVVKVPVKLADVGFAGKVQVRDLWQQKNLGAFTGEFAPEVPGHGAGLYRLSGEPASKSTELAPAAPPDLDTAYLFTYFIGNGEDGLHLAWSGDGYKWEALKGGKSFLTPAVGESKLMRDPCVARGPDGTYHMVWTDSWWSRTIGHAATKDFVNWSEQQTIPVMGHEPAARNCWAPEIVWDAKRTEFLIFWATTITNQFLETVGGGDSNHRMYATTTKDFKTFTPTKLFYDPGFNVIDATILPAFGKYYLIIKDERKTPPKKHLRIASSDDMAGPYTDLQPPFTRDWVEGPTAIQVGDEFLVYYDGYTAHRYEAMRSKDLKSWEDVSSKLSFPRGTRHGTVTAVPMEFVKQLRAAVGDE